MNFKKFIEEVQQLPKKGDTIYTADIWANGFSLRDKNFVPPSIYIRKLLVKSWGKKQATFVDPYNNAFVKFRGYTATFPWAWEPSGLQEQIKKCEQNLREHFQRRIQSELDWIKRYGHLNAARIPQAQQEIERVKKLLESPIDVKDYVEPASQFDSYRKGINI